jgi:predicted  nucleic acid-binding Zn-ribbon protein
MIENLRQVITSRPQAQVSDGGSDETIESVALAGVAAIQQLIAERDNLRNCVSAQQRDLVAMNAANEELRRRLGLIRQHYLELGRRVLAQLEQFDRVTREAIEDNQATIPTPQEEANLIALAHRLKPNNRPAKSANEAMSF